MLKVKNNRKAIEIQKQKIKMLEKALQHAKACLLIDKALIRKGYDIKAVNVKKLL